MNSVGSLIMVIEIPSPAFLSSASRRRRTSQIDAARWAIKNTSPTTRSSLDNSQSFQGRRSPSARRICVCARASVFV